MKRFDVVAFGSGVVDVFALTDVDEKKGKLDLDVGSKYLIEGLRTDVGGGATNVAVAFSRFGLKTGCVCGVGDDANGREVLSCLKSEKVKFLGKIDREKGTGYSVIVNSRKHNRTILTYKGASNEVEVEDVSGFRCRWLYFSSLLGKSFGTQKKIARRVVSEGGRLVLNPSSYSIREQNLRGLLRLASVLILNKEEGEMLVKKYKGKGESLVEGLQSLGPGIVVVTNKDKATVCGDGKGAYKVFPDKSKKVVERTGAGDAFAAGFVAGLVRGWGVEDCLKLGIEESEAVLGHFGAKNDLMKRKLK